MNLIFRIKQDDIRNCFQNRKSRSKDAYERVMNNSSNAILHYGRNYGEDEKLQLFKICYESALNIGYPKTSSEKEEYEKYLLAAIEIEKELLLPNKEIEKILNDIYKRLEEFYKSNNSE